MPVPSTKPEEQPDRVFGYIDISAIDNTRYEIVTPKHLKGRDAPSRARRPIRAGDVLFSNVRTYLRNIALVPEDLPAQLCSTGFTVLRAAPGVDPRYLFRYVLTDDFIDQVTPQQTGTHYPATSDAAVLAETMPIAPSAEQERIAAKVEELLANVNAARDRLARVPTILRRCRQAVLASACSGRLTEDWRGSPTPNPGDTDGQFPLPQGWAWVRFGTLLVEIRGGSTAVPQNAPTPYPILRSSSVRPGAVDLHDVRFVIARDAAHDDALVADGDLLFTRLSGSLEFVGNCAVVTGVGHQRVWFPDRIFRGRLSNPTQARYFEKVFATPFVRRLLAAEAKSSAGHQRISITTITKQTVPVPPEPEQHEIVRRVDALFKLADAIEKRVAAATARANKLTQAILAKAFRGELVPTEAELARQEGRDYEPASALLARIRAERTAGHGQSQGKGRGRKARTAS